MRELLARIIHAIERPIDALSWAVRQRLGVGPVQILPYRGYGTHQSITALARAVSDWRYHPAAPGDSTWHNIVNALHAFHTHEIPYARVRARFMDQEQIVTADEEGDIVVIFDLDSPPPTDRVWHYVDLELIDYADQLGARAQAPVLIPSPDADFGIISDIDDTIIHTGVANKLAVALNTIRFNPHTRRIIPGAPGFFRALERGTSGGPNPVFWVSTSPFNVFDYLELFLDVHDFPVGPMTLINMGFTATQLFRPNPRAHKQDNINQIMDTYPHLPFILIGDNGEEDAEIAVTTAHLYPGRVKAIYIRDCAPHKPDLTTRELAVEARRLGIDLLLVPDMIPAAEHAAANGFITADALDAITAPQR